MPKAARKTKKKTPTVTAETLKKKKDAIQDEFSKATNTKTAYKGYRDRGIAIIADVVATRKQKEKEDPSWKCPDGIDTDLLEKALKGPPNKHSVYVLGLYLTQKCAVEDLGKSTAEGIHGAFANYWDNL
jgi:adenosylmethionine-8-amino-7-oxononanoate aminotransferase